ncbi:hypothetical protein BSG1_15143 [Bacillus sp. SG-1]|nr:hypothetical protein BSG1_15143 [Bacillus sp. SG-1]
MRKRLKGMKGRKERGKCLEEESQRHERQKGERKVS